MQTTIGVGDFFSEEESTDLRTFLDFLESSKKKSPAAAPNKFQQQQDFLVGGQNGKTQEIKNFTHLWSANTGISANQQPSPSDEEHFLHRPVVGDCKTPAIMTLRGTKNTYLNEFSNHRIDHQIEQCKGINHQVPKNS